jgi:UDP-GlcNAc:undecaprenyl-phosphate GlcNAc-1-phosphate transferase
MKLIILGSFLSFIVCFYAIPLIIFIANEKKLFDKPDDRKIHINRVSSLGGLGIFAGFIMALLLCNDITNSVQAFQFIVASFMVVFFFGIKDDILVLSPLKKIIGQLITALILVFKARLIISDMHGFLTIGTINQTTSYFLSIFTIIVVMNAYNLIDGVDGLAGIVGVITSGFFGLFFFINGDFFYSLIGFAFASSLLGFLIYNYSPAKIFMGDTGAMLNGVVNAILVIHFIETAQESKIFPIASSPAMGFGVLIMPLLDTLRVFFIRMIHGRSPFSPDRNHLHHLLLDRGMNHKKVTLIIASSCIFFIFFTYKLLQFGTTLVILTQIAFFFSGILALYLTKSKETGSLKVVKGEFSEPKSNKKKSEKYFL